MTKIQIRANQNPEILIGTEVNLNQVNKYNARTVGKHVTLGGNTKVLRRRMKMILLMKMILHPLEVQGTTSLSLMTQAERYEFIF